MDKNELLSLIRSSRGELEDALAMIPVERWQEPLLDNSWSVKDLLAHLAFWENHAAQNVEKLLSGRDPIPVDESGTIDEVNARVYRENKGLPLEKTRNRELAAYRRILALAESTPAENLFTPGIYPWLNGEALYVQFHMDTYGHYPEHTQALKEAIAAL